MILSGHTPDPSLERRQTRRYIAMDPKSREGDSSVPPGSTASGSRTDSRRRVAAVAALLLAGVVAGGGQALAQGLRLDLVPSERDVLLCDRPRELRLSIELENPSGLAVHGYQLFLRFPAERIDLVKFEPEVVSGTLSVNGPPPFGAGYPGCAFSDSDTWDDGKGLDVFSVVASVFGEGRSDPIMGSSATLGDIVFEIPGDASAGSVELGIVLDGCPPFLTQTVAFFDDMGELLPLGLGATTVEVAITREAKVENLTCTDEPGGSGVALNWTAPVGASVDGYIVYRQGEVLFPLVPSFASSVVDDSPRECSDVEYEVVVRSNGSDASCGERCTMGSGGANVPFRRGDVNGDQKVNVADPIAALRFQFHGMVVSCVDAADFDDNGKIEITDPIQMLTYVFLDGAPPPEPFTAPGEDPTPDDLCCFAAP